MSCAQLDPQIVGRRFGRVVVTRNDLRTPSNHVLCTYVCDCGTEKTARATDLVRWCVVSCGCLKLERPRLKNGRYAK
jgi:hypothetical protein